MDEQAGSSGLGSIMAVVRKQVTVLVDWRIRVPPGEPGEGFHDSLHPAGQNRRLGAAPMFKTGHRTADFQGYLVQRRRPWCRSASQWASRGRAAGPGQQLNHAAREPMRGRQHLGRRIVGR